MIADPQVRYCGTLGGNVANGDPGNDMPAIMHGCWTPEYVLARPQRQRSRGSKSRGNSTRRPISPRRDEGEILTSDPHSGSAGRARGYAYEKQKRKVGDYATAPPAVIADRGRAGNCRDAASIALTNVADTPLWAEAAGRRWSARPSDEEAAIAQPRARQPPSPTPAQRRTWPGRVSHQCRRHHGPNSALHRAAHAAGRVTAQPKGHLKS